MKIAKRLPIFVAAGLLTFALGAWMTPVEQQSILVLNRTDQRIAYFLWLDGQAAEVESLPRSIQTLVF